MKKISIKQLQTLEAIEYFINENGYPPTIKELSKLTKNKSESTVFNKLMILEDKGYIKTKPGCARSIVVLKRCQNETII